jgi:hypothetical protein
MLHWLSRWFFQARKHYLPLPVLPLAIMHG